MERLHRLRRWIVPAVLALAILVFPVAAFASEEGEEAGGIEWSSLLTGIKSGFEAGVSEILPIAGVMLLAGILFGVYKKYSKKAAS